MKGLRWLAELAMRNDDGPSFRIGRRGESYVAEWIGLATLSADLDGEHMTFEPEPDADPDVVQKIRCGLARALVDHLRGKLNLHASAVAWEGVAIACVGASGAGKSTLAAEACERHDFSLLADDIARVDFGDHEARVTPTERDHWLDAESRAALGISSPMEASKSRAPASRFAASDARLLAIVALRFDDSIDAPALRPLRGHAALASLIPNIVRFRIDDPGAMTKEVSMLADLVRLAPMLEMVRPRRMPCLRASGDLLVGLVKGARP